MAARSAANQAEAARFKPAAASIILFSDASAVARLLWLSPASSWLAVAPASAARRRASSAVDCIARNASSSFAAGDFPFFATSDGAPLLGGFTTVETAPPAGVTDDRGDGACAV